MPRRIKSLKKFNYGTFSNPDISDVPDEAAVASANLDGDTIDGELRGIESHSTFGTFPNVYNGEFIYDDVNDKWDYVYFDKATSQLKVINDFYGTPTVPVALASSVSSATFVVRNRAAHIGIGNSSGSTPKWTGYITYGQYSNSSPGAIPAPSGLQVLEAKIAKPILTTTFTAGQIEETTFAFSTGHNPAVPDEYFQDGSYYYKISYVYDGVQESPLSDLFGIRHSIIGGSSFEYLSFKINMYGTPASRRITSINVYRAEGFANATEPNTLYRLVKNIDINDADWGYSSINSLHYYDFTDYGTIGITYDDNTGISETLDNTIVNYTLSAQVNGYHFVGKNYHSSLDDAAFILFRSKKLRYDTFDWTNDILHLPKVPTAMAGYAGRLYVFDENNIYKINPDGLYIEDIFPGVGCLSQRSVITTNYGMFIADTKGIYLNDGNRVTPISNPIKYATLGDITNTASYTQNYPGYYESLKVTFKPILTFNSIKNYLMVNMYDSSGNLITWAYHIFKKRWDFWNYNSLPVNANSGFVTGKDGSIYLSNATAMYKLFQTGNYNWVFISKRFDFGKLSQNKQISKIVFQNVPYIAYKYGKNGADPATTMFVDDAYINVYMDTIQLYLSSSVPCYGVDIVYREMVGER